MRYKTYKIVLVVLAMLVFHQNASIANQEKKLSFTMVLCGVGPFHSKQAYKASDGTFIDVHSDYYLSEELANEALKKELIASPKILKEENSKDPISLVITQRFIIQILNEHVSKIAIIEIKGNNIYKITGTSLKHINEFRKYLKKDYFVLNE